MSEPTNKPRSLPAMVRESIRAAVALFGRRAVVEAADQAEHDLEDESCDKPECEGECKCQKRSQ